MMSNNIKHDISPLVRYVSKIENADPNLLQRQVRFSTAAAFSGLVAMVVAFMAVWAVPAVPEVWLRFLAFVLLCGFGVCLTAVFSLVNAMVDLAAYQWWSSIRSAEEARQARAEAVELKQCFRETLVLVLHDFPAAKPIVESARSRLDLNDTIATAGGPRTSPSSEAH